MCQLFWAVFLKENVRKTLSNLCMPHRHYDSTVIQVTFVIIIIIMFMKD